MKRISEPRDEAATIEAIRARADAATPGPWECSIGDGQMVYVGAPEPLDVHVCSTDLAGIDFAVEDAEFIAHAREDVPWLLAALAAAQAENKALTKQAAADHRGWSASRRSICEQSDRYKAERDEARAGLAAAQARAEAEHAERERLGERLADLERLTARTMAGIVREASIAVPILLSDEQTKTLASALVVSIGTWLARQESLRVAARPEDLQVAVHDLSDPNCAEHDCNAGEYGHCDTCAARPDPEVTE